MLGIQLSFLSIASSSLMLTSFMLGLTVCYSVIPDQKDPLPTRVKMCRLYWRGWWTTGHTQSVERVIFIRLMQNKKTPYNIQVLQYSHLGWEATEEAVPEVYKRECKVLVKEVTQEITHPEVGPAPVHQQEPLQVPKLGKGVIWCQNSLHPLLSADTNTDVSSWGRNTQFGLLAFKY